jgi:uncharacterized protein (TIGR00730 family)
MDQTSICVFTGSNFGGRGAYAKAARRFGERLAARNLGLVYGGGSVGLMGVVADAVLAGGGRVTGVLPEALIDKEVGHTGLTQLIVEPSMHARKARMAALSSAFAVLPGGIGTLEEMFEISTWIQLGILDKPIGVLNVEGFYDRMLEFLDQLVDESFLTTTHRQMLLVESNPDTLIDKLLVARTPTTGKWISERS